MRVWERIKWTAAVAGISWPFAAPFVIVVLLNLALFCFAVLGSAVDAVFGGHAFVAAAEGSAILLGLFDAFAIFFLIIWTAGYAVLQMTKWLD